MSDDVLATARSPPNCTARSARCSPTCSTRAPRRPRPSWLACAEAGLLGLAAPAGVRRRGSRPRRGRRARARARLPAPVDLPFRETLVCGLLTLVRSGTPEQQETFVPQIAAGKLLVAPALNEPGRALPRAARDAARGRPADRSQDRGAHVRASSPAVTRCCSSPPPTRPAARSSYSSTRTSDGVTRTTTPSSRGAAPRRPTSSTAPRSSACSPTGRPTCSASTPSPGCCSRATDSSPERAT